MPIKMIDYFTGELVVVAVETTDPDGSVRITFIRSGRFLFA